MAGDSGSAEKWDDPRDDRGDDEEYERADGMRAGRQRITASVGYQIDVFPHDAPLSRVLLEHERRPALVTAVLTPGCFRPTSLTARRGGSYVRIARAAPGF
jgi:hypothetical protein